MQKLRQDSPDPHAFGHGEPPVGMFRNVRAWYSFPLHAILVIVFGLVALFILDGATFPTASDAPLGSTFSHIFTGSLAQADVTTLVSAALVAVRITLNICSGTAVQRCVFILLEKCGITLREIESIFSWQRGPLGTNGFQLGTMLLLLLLIPAQLSAPLAQGALSWEPVLSLKPAEYDVTMNVAGAGPAFGDFQKLSEVRDFSIRRASGLAVIHRFGPDFYSVMDAERKVPSRRWAPALREHKPSTDMKGYQALPGNTTVANTTLPFFRMSNFTWVDYDESFLRYLDKYNGLFNVTSGMNPITTSLAGNAMILRDSPMDSWISRWPDARRVSETFRIAVLTERLDSAHPTGACGGQSNMFGSLPPNKQHSVMSMGASNFTNCYLFAEVSVTAGTTQCYDCSIISPGVVQRPGNATFDFALSPDPLVDIIMGMLPETLLAIVTANATYAPTWQNLDGYVAGAFSAAYQASWNDLTDRLKTVTTNTNVSLPSYPLRADVNSQRVETWMALHLLVIISGLVLALLQSRCSQAPAIDFVAACLLTDPTSIIRSRGADGIRTNAHIPSKDSDLVGKLLLREEGSSDLSTRYRVLKRKKDGGQDQLRSRRAAAKQQSWSDLSLLSQRSTLYDRVPSAQSTPQSWQLGSPGFAR